MEIPLKESEASLDIPGLRHIGSQENRKPDTTASVITERKSSSIVFSIIIFLFWPIAGLTGPSIIFLVSCSWLLTITSIAMHVFPFTFCVFIIVFYTSTGLFYMNLGIQSMRDMKVKNPKIEKGLKIFSVFLFILGTFIGSVLEGDLYIGFCLFSYFILLLGWFLFAFLNVLVELVFKYQFEKLMKIDFVDYETMNPTLWASDLIIRLRKTESDHRNRKKIATLLDSSFSFSFLFVLFLLVCIEFIYIQGISDDIGTGNYGLASVSIFSYRFTLYYISLVSFFAYTGKVYAGFKTTLIHSQFMLRCNLARNALSVLKTMPEIMFEDPKINVHQTQETDTLKVSHDRLKQISGGVINQDYLAYFWNIVKADTDKKSMSIKELKTIISANAVEVIEKYDLAIMEYESLYNIVQYKFLGLFTVDRQLVLKLVFTAGSAMASGIYALKSQ